MRRIALLLASAALAVLLASGVALALADSPTTKEDCKNGGYAKYGFKNQGQCLKAVNHATLADTTPPETFGRSGGRHDLAVIGLQRQLLGYPAAP